MPHSSGGGSHGGGSHGGSHGGSSGPRISKHYFAGARRYRKHNMTTGFDEYVYASSKPQKANIGSIITLAIFALMFVGIGCAGVITDRPAKLKTKYWDKAAIHDEVEILENEESLLATLEEFQDITGICPVFYTTVDEIWKDDYSDLESYAYDVYVDHYEDESHFVIVYSISINDWILLNNGSTEVPDYSWEAIQGYDTDNLLTETTFKHFADRVQLGLEDGKNPAEAFDEAFQYLNKRFENQLKPFSITRILSTLMSCTPMFIVSGVFVLFIVLSIKQYKKDKDIVYEEVPLDVNPQDPVQAAATTVTSGYRSREVHYDLSKGGPVPTGAKVLVYAITIPFIVIGITITAAGIGMMKSGSSTEGGFMLIFGVVWTLISLFTLVTMAAKFAKAKKLAGSEPVTSVVQKTENTVNNGQQSTYTSAPDQTEFDTQFFSSSRSDIEDDDEDYKRMKRRGFE